MVEGYAMLQMCAGRCLTLVEGCEMGEMSFAGEQGVLRRMADREGCAIGEMCAGGWLTGAEGCEMGYRGASLIRNTPPPRGAIGP